MVRLEGKFLQVTPLLLQVLPKFTHLAEEAVRLGAVGFGGAFGVELLEQLLLPGRQVDRRLDHRLDEHVAPRTGAQDRHALVLEPELVPGRRAGGKGDPRQLALDGRHLDDAAERRRGHRDRRPAL